MLGFDLEIYSIILVHSSLNLIFLFDIYSYGRLSRARLMAIMNMLEYAAQISSMGRMLEKALAYGDIRIMSDDFYGTLAS